MKEEKQQKERNKYAILLIIGTALGTAMILIGSYFNFIRKDEPTTNEGENNHKVVINIKEVDNNMVFESQNFDDFIKEAKNSKEVKNVEYEIIDDLSTNYYINNIEYTIKIQEDGKVVIVSDDSNEDSITLLGIKNAKSIINTYSCVYIITNDGYLYSYSYIPNEQVHKIEKLTKILNADKLVTISILYNISGGGSDSIGVIDKNNNYYELFGEAV